MVALYRQFSMYRTEESIKGGVCGHQVLLSAIKERNIETKELA